MGTFTPGPWHDSKYAGHEGMQDRSIYADSEHAFDLAIVRNGGNDAECAANARLIAAAPDLLAALEYVEQFSGPMDARQMETLAKRCRAAIAIAKAGA